MPDDDSLLSQGTVDFRQAERDHANGQAMTNPRVMRYSDIGACPFLILVPEHYRADGSCRCDNPDHREMAEWGYSWDETARRWTWT